jgi:hypothetical protein
MFTLQKRAIRVVHKAKFNSHTSPLFIKMNSLTLEDLYTQHSCKIVHKKINNKLHPSITNLLSTVNELHQYDTRYSNNIRPHRTTNNISKQLLSIKVASIWNSLPDPLKSQTNLSLSTFSNNLKKYLRSKYPSTCTIDNCYVCNS